MINVKNNVKNKNIIFLVIIFLLLLFYTQFFSYKNWNPTFAGQFSYFIELGLVIIYFIIYKNKTITNTHFNIIVLCLMLFPFYTIFSSYVLYQTSPLQSFKLMAPNLIWIIYFWLHKQKINSEQIIKVVTIFALIFFIIQILQQLFYPKISLFGIPISNDFDNVIESRNSLWRFRISGILLVEFALYYYWEKLLKNFNLKNILFISIFLISIYLTLTRQLILTTLITLLLSFFMVKGYKKKYIILLLIISITILSIKYYNAIYGFFIEKTVDDIDNNNIRILESDFYLTKIFNNIISIIFGAGIPEISLTWQKNYNFFTSDIGVIGIWFHYGFLYLILYIVLLYKVLVKFRQKLPLYIKLFSFATFFICFMIFPYRSPFEYIIWCILLYLADLHINQSFKFKRNFLKNE